MADAVWWQLSQEEIAQDEGAQEARRLAYFNTFYGHEEGRQVLLDVQQLCYAGADSPEAALARIRLYHEIRARAGIDRDAEKSAIDAEAKSI